MALARQATFLLALVAESTALLTIGRTRDVANFDSFIAQYGRSYAPGSREYEDRRKLFEMRIGAMKNHNAKPARLWNAAINHLSDRTDSELVSLRGLRPLRVAKDASIGAVTPHRLRGHFLHQMKSDVLPSEMSWKNLSSVQADTNQAQCGSCWAVATATMLAANSEINGYSRTYSAQELVDCVPNPHRCGGTGGCQGSTAELAMNWVMESSLAASDITPYYGVDGTCKKDRGASLLSKDGGQSLEQMIQIGFHGPLSKQSKGLELGLRGWERLAENEYEPLLRAVALSGPVAVSVSADTWNSYGSGIFDDCGKDAVVDHAVTMIGYGIDATRDNKPYWLIKNSWGLSWGEDGNIRLLRHVNNEEYCGTDYQPDLGTGCDGGPSSVKVCGMCGILYDSVVAHFHPSM